MNINAILAFAGAAISTALGLGALGRRPRTIAQYALALGLFVFAWEALLNGFTFLSRDGEQRMIFQTYALLAMAALPGPWLVFSVTYSRGNWKTFLKKWRLLIIAAFA